MASESIAHSAIGLMGYWLRAHSGSRNNCNYFRESPEVGYIAFETAPELNVENSILSVFLITILLLIVSPSCGNWVSGTGVTN